MTFREEVLNVILAELLQARGIVSLPETVRRLISRGRRLPDITIADLFGVPIVVEGRIDGAPGVAASLVDLTRSRIEEGISPIALAVLYPAGLQEAHSLPALRRSMARATLRVSVFSEHTDGEWATATVDGLAEIVRTAYELLVSDDVVTTAVDELSAAIDAASEIIAASPAAAPRLRHLLGIPEDTRPGAGEEDD